VVTPAGLPRSAKLLRPSEFARVYGRRQSAADGPIVVYAAPNDLPDRPVRIGVSVSRRVGHAVIRNRWKRRLREVFREVRSALPPGTDLVVVVRGGPVPAGAEGQRRLGESLATLVARITARRGYASVPAGADRAGAEPKRSDGSGRSGPDRGRRR
jgi:ribonuclease P protein component